jgi:hypothetical protein
MRASDVRVCYQHAARRDDDVASFGLIGVGHDRDGKCDTQRFGSLEIDYQARNGEAEKRFKAV